MCTLYRVLHKYLAPKYINVYEKWKIIGENYFGNTLSLISSTVIESNLIANLYILV